MAISSGDNITTTWRIDTKEGREEVALLANKVREYDKAERNLSVAMKRLNKIAEESSKTNKKLVSVMEKLNVGMTVSILKANLYTAGLSAINSKIGEAIKNTDKFNNAQNVYTGNIEEARKATLGLVSDLDLMESSNKLNTLGVKLSSEQTAELLGNVQKLSDAMGEDMAYSINSITTALARGSVQFADNIGIVVNTEKAYEDYAIANKKLVKDLTETEKKQAKVNHILDQAKVKAGELPEKLNTVGTAAKQMSVDLSNMFTSLASDIDLRLGNVLDNLANRLTFLRTGRSPADIKQLFDKDKDAKTARDIEAARSGLIGGGPVGVSGVGGGEGLSSSLLFPSSGQVIGRGRFKEGAEFSSQIDLFAKEKEESQRKSIARMKKMWSDARSEFLAQEKAFDQARIDSEKYVTEESVKEWTAQIEHMKILHDLEIQRQLDMKETANRLDDLRAAQKKQLEEEKKSAEAKTLSHQLEQRSFDMWSNLPLEFFGMAEQALSNLSAGIVESALAAAEGGDSFGVAMQKVVKSTLKGIAITSAVRAIQALALAAFNAATGRFEAAGFALKSAGLFTAAAAAAGVASSAIPSGGGGGSASAGSLRGGGERSYSADRTARPMFTKKQERVQPLNIKVYIGDPGSPTAALMMQKQIKAQVDRQQQATTSDL